MKINKTAIVMGGSKGIGRGISLQLKKICSKVVACSRKDVDTSNLKDVHSFLHKYKAVDILVLNTGGPPPIDFYNIKEKDWHRYFNQLFLGFALILQKIKIKKNGYVFLISSSIIKEPAVGLEISSSLRSGFVSLFKSISLNRKNKKISFINIALGPFKTNRVKELVKNIKLYEKNLPLEKIGDPKEIGKFVKFILENKIKYLNGSTVYFDGNINKSII
jgi:3-oxoacyl-[acyl-carrier protein] reductase